MMEEALTLCYVVGAVLPCISIAQRVTGGAAHGFYRAGKIYISTNYKYLQIYKHEANIRGGGKNRPRRL